jgi:hypothetical protein
VSALPLSAVGSSGRKSGVADSADLLVTLRKSQSNQSVEPTTDDPLRTLYLLAKTFKEGSMIPPRNRKTKCKVDSFWML